MRLNHLHIHVRDIESSEAFYGRWFGFRHHAQHGTLRFLRDAGGLDLALEPDPAPEAMPSWFHFGFRLESADEVRALAKEMEGAKVPMTLALRDHGDFVVFCCTDPDGYAIEVYWE